jgi:hypothetical protein
MRLKWYYEDGLWRFEGTTVQKQMELAFKDQKKNI